MAVFKLITCPNSSAAEDWAMAACRAYNNWLYEKFTNVSPRIKGMALIPIQDVDAAVDEMRRAMKQLGMAGVKRANDALSVLV